MTPRFSSLDDWLRWQESLHWTSIDLGLNRIREVANRMQLFDITFPVITVAGTNGKGSTVAMLEAILHEEGYQTGTYTSPYLYRYNERIKLSTKEADDALICTAFEAIDQARMKGDEVSLTYFEFATLAAIWIFKERHVEVAILEVGMGGRLDAVNLWDADVAIITSIGIDHVKWLGDNREDIGREKAGIMRTDRPVISGDPNPPESIATQAARIKAILYQAGDDFSWEKKDSVWNLMSESQCWENLPLPALKGNFQLNNAAVALMALLTLRDKLPVTTLCIKAGLQQVKLPGRLEYIQTQPDIILDVAHNAHAAKQLALWLSSLPNKSGKTYAVFSMLDDKDISEVARILNPYIDHWFIATLDDPRGLPVKDLEKKMKGIDSKRGKSIDIETVTEAEIDSFESISDAWNVCKNRLEKKDKVIVFGSFLVLSEFKVIF